MRVTLEVQSLFFLVWKASEMTCSYKTRSIHRGYRAFRLTPIQLRTEMYIVSRSKDPSQNNSGTYIGPAYGFSRRETYENKGCSPNWESFQEKHTHRKNRAKTWSQLIHSPVVFASRENTIHSSSLIARECPLHIENDIQRCYRLLTKATAIRWRNGKIHKCTFFLSLTLPFHHYPRLFVLT